MSRSTLTRWRSRAGATVVAVASLGAAGIATAPVASAQWTNCGEHICTDYLDRQETEEQHRTMQQVGRIEHETDLFCDLFWLPCFVRPSAEFEEKREQLALAAAVDGCLKIEYPADPSQRTWVRYGVTDDPAWCYEYFSVPSF